MHRKSSLSRLDSRLLSSLPPLAATLHAASNLQSARLRRQRRRNHQGHDAIQEAIDTCAAKGGGTVRLTRAPISARPSCSKATSPSSSIRAPRLLGSPDHADYPAKIEFRLPASQSLVSATNAENVAITGEGTIDGQGESWWRDARTVHDAGVMGNPHPRPRLVVFDHCKHVRVEGVTIQNSPFWQLVPYYCDDVSSATSAFSRRIHRRTPTPSIPFPHPTSASIISMPTPATTTSPSNPAPSTRPAAMTRRDITISDCTFLHGHGLSIGSEIAGGARNIVAERIHFDGTDNGIRVKANRDRGNDVSEPRLPRHRYEGREEPARDQRVLSPHSAVRGHVAPRPSRASRRTSTTSCFRTSPRRARDGRRHRRPA
jgi:hypothetical protein